MYLTFKYRCASFKAKYCKKRRKKKKTRAASDIEYQAGSDDGFKERSKSYLARLITYLLATN